MPILNLQFSTPLSAAPTRCLAESLTELTHSILEKDPALTAITITQIKPEEWFIAGQPLSTTKRSSFSLDIKITDETNTKSQKARYIQAVFDAMQSLLGELDEHSYVHVHDVRASAYGYAGKTQEYRLHRR